MSELEATIEKLGNSFEEFKNSIDERLAKVELARNRIEAPGAGEKENPEDDVKFQQFGVTNDGQVVPVLKKSQRLADFTKSGENDWNLADFCRASMGHKIGKKDVGTGAALVPTMIGSRIIDMVRQKLRVVQAGSVTIPISGQTNLAKITGDPDVTQHTEGSEDISDSSPTFAAVSLDPKAIVAAIPLSNEVVQDSPNLDAALRITISRAFAKKVDDLSLATILADASSSPSSVVTDANDPSTWGGMLSGVSTMLSNDLEVPDAVICNPADKVSRHSQQSKVYDGSSLSADGPWLGVPPLLQGMADLDSSGINSGKAVYGGFSRGFGIAVRQDMSMELLRFHAYKKYTHVLVVHARMDGYLLQPGALMVQDNT